MRRLLPLPLLPPPLLLLLAATAIVAYGITDDKIPVFVDISAAVPSGTEVDASVIMFTPANPNGNTLSCGSVTSSQYEQLSVPQGYRSEKMDVQITLKSDGSHVQSPTLYRWTLQSWPAVVTETQITPVILLHKQVLDGGQVITVNPYESYNFLNTLRENQTIVPYNEGPWSANVVIESLDWLPHSRTEDYENGFQGDCVVGLKTIGGMSYTPTPTV